MLKNLNKVLGINARNRIYLRANKKAARGLADDKLKTKKLLRKHAIGTAELVAVIQDSNDLREFDWNSLPNSFVIKPNRGFGGQGILVIFNRLKNGNWITTNKRQLTVDDLQAHIRNILDGNFSLLNTADVVLIESRLSMSPFFKIFSTNGIPDIRVIVYNGIPVMAMLRVPTKKSEGKANLAQGGIAIGIDIATGRTTYAVVKSWLYEKEIEIHPDTGVHLRGKKLPVWDDILLTAVRAADVTGMRYAGVDVSVDKTIGPVVLELNARPGLGIQIANMLPLRERLQRIRGLKVKSPEHGISLARELFVGPFDAEVESITGRQVISLVEPVTLWADPAQKQDVFAKIDSGAHTSSIDEQLARQLGFGEAIDAFKKIQLPDYHTKKEAEEYAKELKKKLQKEQPGIANISVVTSSHGMSIRLNVRVTVRLSGREMVMTPNVYEREYLTYPMLIGASDLGYYLLDPSKPVTPEIKEFRARRKKEIEDVVRHEVSIEEIDRGE
jgi:alpha-L-glutamate ligase-like protein